jgi:hypothetical protein
VSEKTEDFRRVRGALRRGCSHISQLPSPKEYGVVLPLKCHFLPIATRLFRPAAVSRKAIEVLGPNYDLSIVPLILF